jgi:energy-coupling factor transporter ATP-binding protein EcfA2
MPNSIKYNVSAETLALKKGNFWIGTGDVGKGPTSSTGFYNGITPPSGGYTIYLNKASNGPSIYTPSNDAQLIDKTNKIAGTSYTTVNECFNYYAGQSDKMVFNIDYPQTITNGLILYLDAKFIPSYPRNGTTWYDISSGGTNGTLVNGPTYNSNGAIVFDGTDDIVNISAIVLSGNFSITQTMNLTSTSNGPMPIGGGFYTGGADYRGYVWFRSNDTILFMVNGEVGYVFSVLSSKWVNKTINYTVTRSGSTAKIYINGVEEGSGSISTSNFTIRTIGASYNYPAYSCNGSIYTTSLYNRSLTLSEILQNYYQGNIVTSNLLVNLDAGNVVSYPGTGTVWNDLSGNGNNFTLYNGVGFSTDNGGCLTFDGTNDYASSSSNINLSSYDYVVVEVFYKCNSTAAAMLFEHTSDWNSNTGGFGLATNVDGNNQLTNCNHTNHNTEVARNYLMSDNSSWNNNLNLYSKISDSTGRLVYVNGGLTSFTATGGYPTGTATSPNGSFPNAIFYIGSRGGSSSFFNGRISSIKIYGFKINSSQVQQNFNTYRSRFGI